MRASTNAIIPGPEDIEFSYDNQPFLGTQGDTIASALINVGQYSCRVTAVGEPRGVFCGMGVCQECAVCVNGIEGELACMTYLKPGMNIRSQPQYRDIPHEEGTDLPEVSLDVDVLVIGSGPAGMSAAVVAAESGLRVALVDERGALGGQYFKQPASDFTLIEDKLDRQYVKGRKLIDRLRESRVSILSGYLVWGAFSQQEVLLAGKHDRMRISTKHMVLATGAFEIGMPVSGWTTPGVMTTGAAQTLLRSYRVALGTEVMISGNGPLNVQMAAELLKSGVKVRALAETSKPLGPRNILRSARLAWYSPGLFFDGLGYLFLLARKRVSFRQGAAVVAISGDSQVTGATVARVDSEGYAIPETEELFGVNAVAMGFGFVPSNEIARSLGCDHEVDPNTGQLRATKDDRGLSSVSGVWIAGDSAGVGGAQVAVAQGTIVGSSIVQEFGFTLTPQLQRDLQHASSKKKRAEKFQAVLWKIFAGPHIGTKLAEEDTIICRCLSLSRADIENTLEPDIRSAGALKRINRAGMGKCQGRYCSSFSIELAARNSGQQHDAHSGYAPAVPYKPVTIGQIAYPEQAIPGHSAQS